MSALPSADPALAYPTRVRATAPPTTFVAVAGPDAAPDTLPRSEGDDRARRMREEALRAVASDTPLALAAFVPAIVAGVLLLGGPWRWPWITLSLIAACVLAWVAVRERRRHARAAAKRAGTLPALALACLFMLALLPWILGSASQTERVVVLIALVLAGLAGAIAWAPLPLPATAAAVLPLSGAAAEWLHHADGQVNAGLGVLLALACCAVAGIERRRWLRGVRMAIVHEDRIRAVEDERDAAIRSDHEKSRFLAIASHDLRQPMHALGLFAATLEKRLQGSGEELLVHNLVRSIDGLDHSFNLMLDISRLDAGTIEPNFQRFPLRDLFRRLHMHFAGQAEQAGLGLRFYPGGKSVTSDPQLLERLLGNLIQNAIKYTQEGGVVVVARTTKAFLNVEVWDTGAGIQASELPRIFDEFYQVGHGGRARDRGFGMGLAIVKRLASLLGHRLVVTSVPGRGTMFRIGIPVGGLAEIQDVTAAADTLPMPQPVGQPRTVLIIDDEEPIREGLSLLLQEWGYEALAVGTVEQATRLMRRRDAPPDLILSDLHLGDGPDGLEAIAAVRRECGFDVKAILITGDTSHEELRRATDSEHPVLFKPVQPRKLLNALRGYIT